MNAVFDLEVKAVSEAGSFEGLASVYGVKDLGGDVVQPGAFRRTLQEKGPERPLLWSHDAREPIGLGKLQDSPAGLVIHGELDLDTQAGRDAYSRVKKRIVKALSFGFLIPEAGAKFIGGVRHLLDLDLYEVSLAVLPMNESALITSVKAQELTSIREFERWLHSVGFSKARAAAIASKGFTAGMAEPESDPVEAELLAFLKQRIQ